MAVTAGGATNHRMGLYDMALIKDNHNQSCRRHHKCRKTSLSLSSCRDKIEVEVTDLNETREALAAGAEIIMLDNMSNETMAEAVKSLTGKPKPKLPGTECSAIKRGSSHRCGLYKRGSPDSLGYSFGY